MKWTATKTKKKRIIILCVLVLFAIWGIRVVALNLSYWKRDGVEVKNYPIGEWVTYEGEYAYGEFPENYEICVNSFEIKDIDDYLQEKGWIADDFENIPDRVCLVNISVRNNSSDAGDGLYLGNIWLYGSDFYLAQNSELFAAENPKMEGAEGIILNDGKSCDLTMAYDANRISFTRYSWNHMGSLEMSLYLTAFPTQKNIVIQ